MDSREDVLKKDVIHEYKDGEGNWIKEKGTLTLNFYKHHVKDDEVVKQVIASMGHRQRYKVRCIDLHGCSRITDAALGIIGGKFRRLTKLNLSSCKGGCGKVTDKGIAAVLRNNPKITHFDFSHCKKATSASIDAVIEHCPNIEELYAGHIGLTSLPGNIGNLSKLKELGLCGNSITTLPLSIGELHENCRLILCNNPIKNVPPSVLETGDGGKAIIRFFFSDAWKKDVLFEYKDDGGNWIDEEGTLQLAFYKHRGKVDDDGVKQVITGMAHRQRDKVRYISLQRCHQITDAALKIMGENFRHLTQLDLHRCVEVTDKGIAAILRNNPKIADLNFSHCKKATSASIDAVIEHCPNIERLYVSSVGLTSLPGNIGNLPTLKELHLRNNSITTLPLTIGELHEDCRLALGNNPIKNVPPPVLKTNTYEGKAIIRFFSDALKKGAAESNQFKMVLLGTGEAGKTSLLNALMGQRKPLTTKTQRTIHVEIRQFELKRSNKALPAVTIKAYDFGGQETYALGQSKYFDDNGIYVLVIDADETNEQVFVAHLQRLQAMAPNAMVLVVLSKVDILITKEALQDKVKWIQNAIVNFNENANAATLKDNHTRCGPTAIKKEVNKQAKVVTSKDSHICRRPVPTDIITLTVQDKPAEARMTILNAILKLLDSQSSMFPSVGMKLPISWLEAMSFIEALRLHGSSDKNKKKLDTKMKELKTRDAQRTADAMIKEPNSAMINESDTTFMNNVAQSPFESNGGYDDSANKDLSGYDGPLHPYIRKENLSKAWIDYVGRNNTNEKQDGGNSVLDDVLDLLKAQGDIIVYGDLVLLDPTFSAFVMKVLTNHTMTIKELQSGEFKQYVTDNKLSGDAYGKLNSSFAKFIDHGHLRSDVLKYLLRRLPIDIRDYDLIICMLAETFAIFLSSNQTNSTSQIVHDPVLLSHLPKNPDFGVIKKHWPKECPENRHQFEIRFEFLCGCPPSLAGHFAASVHFLGICLSAYINGALILVGENESLIYARLEKDNGKKGGYLSLAIRSRSENLDNVDKAIVWNMVKFLEQEKEKKYPGLIYAIEVLCLSCIKNNGTESAYHWNQEDSDTSIRCTAPSCYEDLNMKEMFGDRTQFTQVLNGSAVGSKSNNAATQIVGHVLGKRHVLLSARFNKANKDNEAKARELAQELRNIGVNVYMVDVGIGETFGDKTNFALTHMDAMICFCTFDYGENTISPHSTFGELYHARDKGILYVPIKMCKGWPPKPPLDHDGNNKGVEQNNVAFKNDLIYAEWSDKLWDAKRCAEEVKAALQKKGKCPMI